MNRILLTSASKLFGMQLIAGAFVLYGCKKDELPAAEVNKTKVEVFAGIVDTVAILSDDTGWQASSDDEQVASVNMDGTKAIVTTLRPGKTSIYLWNDQNRVRIEVIATQLSGGWNIMLDPVVAPFIQVDDREIAALIEEELRQDDNNRIRRAYIFGSNGQCSIQTANMVNNDREEFEGNFSLQNSVLTVLYNGFEHVYTLANPPNIRLLKQDLTSYYQQKFPGAGIQKVHITLRMQYFTYG